MENSPSGNEILVGEIPRPSRAYERQILIEQGTTHDPEERRALIAKEAHQLAEYVCTGTEGRSHQGERCSDEDLHVELDQKGQVSVPNACAKCANCVFDVLTERHAPRTRATEMKGMQNVAGMDPQPVGRNIFHAA